jgi:hypothetical protein
MTMLHGSQSMCHASSEKDDWNMRCGKERGERCITHSQAQVTGTLPRSRSASLSNAAMVTSISLGWQPVPEDRQFKHLMKSRRSAQVEENVGGY